jgi:hypothetical protein
MDATCVSVVGRAQETAGLGPGFLAAFTGKAFQGTGPFRFPFRHFAQIQGGAEETGLDVMLRQGGGILQ